MPGPAPRKTNQKKQNEKPVSPPPASGPWDKPGTKAGEQIVGPDGGKMVWVPPGQFTRGLNDDDVQYLQKTFGKEAENAQKWQVAAPATKVRITNGFWIGKTEVHRTRYLRFCRATGRRKPRAHHKGNEYPVTFISWTDAKAYCDYYDMRLPTEAQWEWAARGPKSLRFPWGNEWDKTKCCSKQNRSNAGRPGLFRGLYPADSFPQGASWCGALNMAGNAWEYCRDWFRKNYYENAPAGDPPGPPDAKGQKWGERRVVRGSSFYRSPANCMSGVRYARPPNERTEGDMSFRPCIVPDKQQEPEADIGAKIEAKTGDSEEQKRNGRDNVDRPDVCPNCDAQLPDGAKFCPHCGQKIPVGPPTCPECGKQVPEDARFCPNCGHRIQGATEKTPDAEESQPPEPAG